MLNFRKFQKSFLNEAPGSILGSSSRMHVESNNILVSDGVANISVTRVFTLVGDDVTVGDHAGAATEPRR